MMPSTTSTGTPSCDVLGGLDVGELEPAQVDRQPDRARRATPSAAHAARCCSAPGDQSGDHREQSADRPSAGSTAAGAACVPRRCVSAAGGEALDVLGLVRQRRRIAGLRHVARLHRLQRRGIGGRDGNLGERGAGCGPAASDRIAGRPVVPAAPRASSAAIVSGGSGRIVSSAAMDGASVSAAVLAAPQASAAAQLGPERGDRIAGGLVRRVGIGRRLGGRSREPERSAARATHRPPGRAKRGGFDLDRRSRSWDRRSALAIREQNPLRARDRSSRPLTDRKP